MTKHFVRSLVMEHLDNAERHRTGQAIPIEEGDKWYCREGCRGKQIGTVE